MTHDFVISTEILNEHGYRVLTDGIDTVQYMRNPVVLYIHNPNDKENKGHEVIGRCLKLYKKGTDLMASVEFDVDDPFAKVIDGKVERGFLRMASIYADVKETSSKPEHIVDGQTHETVTKCKLVEISIVPIGGNDDALKLSRNGKTVELQKINLKKETMSKLVTIALALGMMAESTEDTVVGKVQEMKLAKEAAEKEVGELKVKLSTIITAEATALVDKAISLGLIPEVLKDSQMKSLEADFDGQKAVLSKLISDKEATAGQNANHKTIKEVILGGKGGGSVSASSETSFDYLQKHNVVELARIRDNEPAKYAELAKEYGQGVRYSK
ncbi:HK97 family phage prohead protease [Flavobacterium sp.]|uniref:HK97 family phage prohead protease n=1 Tax=Flavobacterium sp. TaxID=239 RepID=UPI0037516F46